MDEFNAIFYHSVSNVSSYALSLSKASSVEAKYSVTLLSEAFEVSSKQITILPVPRKYKYYSFAPLSLMRVLNCVELEIGAIF